jgi:hypothetical protein
LLVQVYDRLRILEATHSPNLEVPLTPEQIGCHRPAGGPRQPDRQPPRAQALIRWDHKGKVLRDVTELRKQAGFPMRMVVRDPLWLAAPAD